MAKIRALTKEQIQKAMACKDADELLALAKREGSDLTKDEAEAYMAEMADFELDGKMLEKAAGGGVCWDNCPGADECGHHACGLIGWEDFKGC